MVGYKYASVKCAWGAYSGSEAIGITRQTGRDWLVDGKRHYGDGLYKKAAAVLGMEEKTLRQYKWLSGTFVLSTRVDKLSHKHHETVASLKTVAEDDVVTTTCLHRNRPCSTAETSIARAKQQYNGRNK